MEKHRQEETQTERRAKTKKGDSWKREDQEGESQKREGAGARNGRKLAKHCVFPRFCGPRESKSRLAKAAVRSRLGR